MLTLWKLATMEKNDCGKICWKEHLRILNSNSSYGFYNVKKWKILSVRLGLSEIWK